MLDGIVPTVAVDDLKSIWSLPEVREHFTNCTPDLRSANQKPSAFSVGKFKSVCSHGSNAMAVFHRLMLFESLRRSIEFGSALPDGMPSDAAFKVLATFPMPIGGPQSFNIFELVSLIQKESEA